MKHLSPKDAWAWLQAEQARRETAGLEGPLFVDVRMEIESLYVGRPPGVENIPWYEFPDLTPDPTRFATAVEAEAGTKERPVLLICRSGKRTLDSGLALTAGTALSVMAQDIVDTAVKAGNFTTLVTAVKAAGLVDTLKGPGPFTVFAPTDAAFAKVPKATLDAPWPRCSPTTWFPAR